MAFINGNSSIVTDGLVFCVDPANKQSYIGSGTTATCLISGFNCSGANGTPNTGTHTPNTSNFPSYSTDNGGIFNFSGGKGINIDGNLGTATASSICMWFYKNSSGTEYFADGRNNGGQWFLSNYSSYNINWHDTLRYNFSATYNANDSAFLNQWHHMIVTSDSSGSKLYLNGYEVSTSTSTSADEDFGINYRIGTRYTTSAEWTGFFGPIYFYNRAITASEVLHNYNALKGRFE